MEVAEPGGVLVVEVGEGAFFEVGFGGAGGIEPGAAFFVQPFGCGCDGDHTWVVDGFSAGRPWEWESFEAGRRGVARVIAFAKPSAHAE